jgi:hypothetical protein
MQFQSIRGEKLAHEGLLGRGTNKLNGLRRPFGFNVGRLVTLENLSSKAVFKALNFFVS